MEILLSIDEVSEILGLKKSTLYRWAWAKKALTYYKIGGKIKYKNKDIEDYIAKSRVAPIIVRQ